MSVFFFMSNCTRNVVPVSGGKGDLQPAHRGGGSLNNQEFFYPSTLSDADPENDDEDNIFYKDSDVLDNERDLGTSAPLIINKVDKRTFVDLRLGQDLQDENRRLDEIEDLRIYVKLEALDDTNPVQYEGEVSIRYLEDGDERGTELDFGMGPGKIKNNTRRHIWCKVGNKNVFHGVFQETESTLALVIDHKTPTDCEENTECEQTKYGGAVWIRAFKGNADTTGRANQVYLRDLGFRRPPMPTEKPCWRIKGGPFDCRPKWLYEKGSTRPTRKFDRLGLFEGLDLKEAFDVSEVDDLFRNIKNCK